MSGATDESSERATGTPGEDPRAVEDQLLLHLPALRAYVRLRMGRELRARESASDLVQSTCREILQNEGQYRHPGPDNFRHWLFTTALRKVKNRLAYHRAGKRDLSREARDGRDSRGEELLAALYQTLSTPSRRLMHRERIEQIEAAFDELSEDHRQVILLSRIVGLPHDEVGRALGRSAQATRSLLHRALAELADKL